jgi:hypothetical protein
MIIKFKEIIPSEVDESARGVWSDVLEREWRSRSCFNLDERHSCGEKYQF